MQYLKYFQFKYEPIQITRNSRGWNPNRKRNIPNITNSQLTASLCSTELAIVEFEQKKKNVLIELKNLKVSLRCANRSRANAKANADRTESKLKISDRVTSDMLEENKEIKEPLEEATSKAESLQSELLESNKSNLLLKQKLDEYDLAKNTDFVITVFRTRCLEQGAQFLKYGFDFNDLTDFDQLFDLMNTK